MAPTTLLIYDSRERLIPETELETSGLISDLAEGSLKKGLYLENINGDENKASLPISKN